MNTRIEQDQPRQPPPPTDLPAAHLAILLEVAAGCAQDRESWGPPGENDRQMDGYYLELIRRRLDNLARGEVDAATRRSALLRIARHAIAGIEALDLQAAGQVQ